MSFEVLACIATLFFLAGIGTPIGYSIILAALVYLGLGGMDLALAGEKIMQGLYRSFVLLAVPLFIVAANIMNAGTISDRLLGFCVAAVGRFRGGLGHVNVVASLIFSGHVGFGRGGCGGHRQDHHRDDDEGRALSPGLRRRDHRRLGHHRPDHPALDPDGSLCAGQPELDRRAVSRGDRAGPPDGRRADGDERLHGPQARFRAGRAGAAAGACPRKTANAFPALLMPVILLYGIYGGVTTPTEAAAIAALLRAASRGAVLPGAVLPRALYDIFVESARASAAVGMVIGGALILNFIVVRKTSPAWSRMRWSGIDVNPTVFLLMVMLLVLLLGCVLDATTIILVIVPLFIPACRELGIDLVHFGVLVVVNSMIGLITPPYGILLFVINAVTGIPLREIIAEVWPFLLVLIGALLLLVLFPGLVLWLPQLLGYGG
jgi:TRAP-type C4-dicarboxylate transport system permease large subunit